MRNSEVILSIVAVLAISFICGTKTRAVEPQRAKKPEAKFKKVLSPGVRAELAKQSKREYKKEHIDAGRVARAGYYILDTYTLVMKNALQPTSTTLWRRQALYHEESHIEFYLYDVTIDGDSGYVLYTSGPFIQLDTTIRKSNGAWSISRISEICRELECEGKTLKSGQILPNNRLRLVFHNRQVEEWSFAGNSPKLLSKNMPFSQP